MRRAQSSHDADENPVPPRDWTDLRRFSACWLIRPPPESPAPHPVWSRMRTMVWLVGKRQPHATCRRRGTPLRRTRVWHRPAPLRACSACMPFVAVSDSDQSFRRIGESVGTIRIGSCHRTAAPASTRPPMTCPVCAGRAFLDTGLSRSQILLIRVTDDRRTGSPTPAASSRQRGTGRAGPAATWRQLATAKG